jgi:GST-like protein
MLDLHYWTTPNGHKITIFLEESGLPYKIHPVNISKGEQFNPDFLAIAPNNRIPAIIDSEPIDGGEPLALFESGAILWYLAEKTHKFIPQSPRQKAEVSQWLFWQMSGLGPMAGQNHHFNTFAQEKIPYAMERYIKETARLYGVLNKQLENKEWVAADQYTIADMAIYPWIVPYEMQSQNLNDFPHLKKWFEKMQKREAIVKAYEIAKKIQKV